MALSQTLSGNWVTVCVIVALVWKETRPTNAGEPKDVGLLLSQEDSVVGKW